MSLRTMGDKPCVSRFSSSSTAGRILTVWSPSSSSCSPAADPDEGEREEEGILNPNPNPTVAVLPPSTRGGRGLLGPGVGTDRFVSETVVGGVEGATDSCSVAGRVIVLPLVVVVMAGAMIGGLACPTAVHCSWGASEGVKAEASGSESSAIGTSIRGGCASAMERVDEFWSDDVGTKYPCSVPALDTHDKTLCLFSCLLTLARLVGQTVCSRGDANHDATHASIPMVLNRLSGTVGLSPL